MDKKLAYNFEYFFCFVKKDNKVRITQNNSPYDKRHRQSNQTEDDISVIFHGKDSKGDDCTNYKTINWELLADDTYWARVYVKYIPGESNTYDQIFELDKLEKGTMGKNPFIEEINK